MTQARAIPRKVPRQERSRATFERILDAATRILIADGYDAATTNRIAAEAGISPGSLYQYFPNKESIVFAAAERMTEEMADHFVNAVAQPTRADVDAIHRVISALVEAMEANRELVRVSVEQLPRLGGSTELRAFERRITDLATGYLIALAGDVDPELVTTTVWIAVQCVEQLTTRYVLERPPIPKAQFIGELTRLVAGYTEPLVPSA